MGGSVQTEAIVERRSSLVDDAEKTLRRWLESSRFRPGDRLPPEAQLAAQLGISRGTLRTALGRLALDGEIVRRQGSGTFVAQGRSRTSSAVPRLRVDSFTARVSGPPLRPLAMSFELEPLEPEVARLFGRAVGERALRIRRVMTNEVHPMAVADDIFHPDLGMPDPPALRASLRAGETVHDALTRLVGVRFSLCTTRITTRMVTPEEGLGRMLELRAPAACLALECVSHRDGRPVLYTYDLISPDKVEVEIVQTSNESQPDLGAEPLD